MAALLGAVVAVSAVPLPAAGHGGEPTITGLRFPETRPDEVWAITDNQGLYAVRPDTTAWLCEDVVAPGAGLRDLAALGEGDRWLVVTEEGFFLSDDAGCSYHAPPAALADEAVVAASAHPERPSDAVVMTRTFGEENDIWRTTDGGGTWTPAGIELRGRFLELMRSEHDPERLYALHDRGAFTTDDGGVTWSPFVPGPPDLEALPSALTLLAAPPGGAGRLFVGVEIATGRAIAASEDAGQTWVEVARVDDFEMALAFDADGREALLVTPFDGARRSDDGGATWAREPLPVPELQRLARDPRSGRLWASTGLFNGGPFALGWSDDMGRTWSPALVAFEDVEQRWACAADAPASRCCGTLCPGLPPGAVCPGQQPAEEDSCTDAPSEPLGGLLDAAVDVDAAADAAIDAELDAAVDAELDAEPDGGVDAVSDAADGSAVEQDTTVTDAAASDQRIVDARPMDQSPPRDGRPPDARPSDATMRPELGLIAPDMTVIAANPPAECGAAPSGGHAPPWPVLMVVAAAFAGRARSRPRP